MPDYLEQLELEPIKKERLKRRIILAIFVAIGAFFVVWFLVLTVATGQLISAAIDGKEALLNAKTAVEELDFELAQKELNRADSRFQKAEKSFTALNTVSFPPWAGSHIEATGALIQSGRPSIDAISELLNLADEIKRLTGLSEQEIKHMTFDELSSESKKNILSRIHTAGPELDLSQNSLAIANAELSNIDETRLLSPFRNLISPLKTGIIQLQESIKTLSIASRLIPEFAGLDQDKTHLLLFLNNTELRPGGGFIGTYGVLKMRNGDIAELITKDVYRLDYPAGQYLHLPAPEPLRTFNSTLEWFFRDSNLSPDFALSSKKGLELFRAEVNAMSPETRRIVQEQVTFNNVIGFTPTYASDLLKITGPVQVGGQTFTSENITDLLEYQVEFGYAEQGIPERQRKEILADLVNQMKSRLYSLPLSEWMNVITATNKALSEKQLVFYSENQEIEDIITKVKWGGRIIPETPDTILYTDTNLASLKTDPAVERSLEYEIFTNSAGERIGRVRMAYGHKGDFDYKTTRYRTYIKLYVPNGSEWIRTSGSLKDDKTRNRNLEAGSTYIGEELGMTTFGTFTSIEPGEIRDLVFEFKLSDQVLKAIDSGNYSLTFFKQIGAKNYPLTLGLDFDKKMNTILDQDRIYVSEKNRN